MKLILGSKSPRRKQLLADLGYQFEIRTKDTDESYPSEMEVEKVPIYIAHQKANALKNELKKEDILLCSDTVVVLENNILGKPNDYLHAVETLQQLSGKTHRVITGVVIIGNEIHEELSVITEVTFKSLELTEIEYYLATGDAMDKAGAYGIQNWIGLIGIEKINGSYTNVVGLPTTEVHQILKKYIN